MEQTRALSNLEQSNPAVFERAMDDLIELNKLSQFLLDSGMVPNHFYEKGPDGKIDRTKGKVETIGTTLLHGRILGLPAMTSLQWIVYVNGLVSIKGDGAKALIFASGKLKKGSWKMEESGSVQEGTYTVKITATRSDYEETLTRSFSIDDAKRAGLWITEQQLNGQYGHRYRQSPWYRYPTRMIYYRALGFLARDLFPDVLSGNYTTEEVIDMKEEEAVIIQSESGDQIHVNDPSWNKQRSERITKSAVDQVDKKHPLTYEDATPEPEPEPQQEEKDVKEPPEGNLSGTASAAFNLKDSKAMQKERERELMNLPASELKKMVEQVPEMAKAMVAMPGKNSNRKLRTIIMAHEQGDLDSLLAQEGIEVKSAPDPEVSAPASPDPEPVEENENDVQAEKPATDDSVSAETLLGVRIPPLNEQGKREFKDAKVIYDRLRYGFEMSNKSFLDITRKWPDKLGQYESIDDFCNRAPENDIQILLYNLNN